MTRLTIRIDFDEACAFGPGKARLLECIDSEGSIRAAAAAMGMSYRRAWMLLKDIDAIVGGPASAAATGGARGGGTTLTKTGRAVLNHYRAIEKRAQISASRNLAALAKLVARPPAAATARTLRKRTSGAMPKAR